MLHFDNRLIRELPGESESANFPRQVHGAVWSPVVPTPVPSPLLLAHSREMAALLGLDEAALKSAAWTDALAGNALIPGMASYATCYGGYQFGSWARQLGDGRAIFLGEVVNAQGLRFELQLKGAGPTGARFCAHRFANSCAARRCIISASPRPALLHWSPLAIA